MEIKFGNIKMKIPNEEYFKKFSSKENPFETMFSKSNPDLYIDVFKEIPTNFDHYFEVCKKWWKSTLKG